MTPFFGAWCHHGLCYDIVDRPLQNIKLDQNLFSNGSSVVVKFAEDVRKAFKKNCQQDCSRGELSTILAGRVSMSGLKGKRVGDSLQ